MGHWGDDRESRRRAAPCGLVDGRRRLERRKKGEVVLEDVGDGGWEMEVGAGVGVGGLLKTESCYFKNSLRISYLYCLNKATTKQNKTKNKLRSSS